MVQIVGSQFSATAVLYVMKGLFRVRCPASL